MLDALDVASMLRGFAVADAVLLVLAVPIWLVSRWLTRRYLGTLPPSSDQPGARKFLIGLVIGAPALALVLLPAFLSGSFASGPGAESFEYQIEGWDGALVVAIFVILFQSLSEELAFRAIAMGLLAAMLFGTSAWVLDWRERRRGDPDPRSHRRRMGWLWLGSGAIANLALSVLFSLVHMDNPNVTGLAAVNIGLLSLVLGQLFWMQGSVLGAWSFHWVWNAGLAIVGLPVSGIALLEPAPGFGFTAARPDVLSGGSFGPEASIGCTVLGALLLIGLVLKSLREMRGTTRRCSGKPLWLSALRRRRGSPSRPGVR